MAPRADKHDDRYDDKRKARNQTRREKERRENGYEQKKKRKGEEWRSVRQTHRQTERSVSKGRTEWQYQTSATIIFRKMDRLLIISPKFGNRFLPITHGWWTCARSSYPNVLSIQQESDNHCLKSGSLAHNKHEVRQWLPTHHTYS